ncbi:MAG: hypothetical protein M3512_06285 [Bacteroidota bacterium]|nr:hypothetical protein [Bacteroidota bacterium]
MDKTLLNIILIYSLIILSNFACTNEQAKNNNRTTTIKHENTNYVAENDSLVLEKSEEILKYLKIKDYKSFSSFFHPTLGIQFSPYGYVDSTQDIRLTLHQFSDFIDSKNLILWGHYDGSGSPIKLSVEDYFDEFVYNKDFLHAEITTLNKMVGSGNSLNNLENVYSGCPFTESHFSGFEEKYGGMDWASLRLVYKKFDENFYLVAIVHDQWTI